MSHAGVSAHDAGDGRIIPPIRVAIAASHPALRTAMHQLVALERRVTVVDVVGDHRGAARCLLQHHPEVMVVALAGALGHGGAAIRELCTLAPATALIIAATATSESYRSVAQAAGATAFVGLDAPPDHLVEAIHRAVDRR